MRKVLLLLPSTFCRTTFNQRFGNGIPFSRQFLYSRYIEPQFQKQGIPCVGDVDMLGECLYTSYSVQSSYRNPVLCCWLSREYRFLVAAGAWMSICSPCGCFEKGVEERGLEREGIRKNQQIT
jgi:hypothetical protein